MCRRLMLCMVSCVLGRLSLSQTTDGKDSQDE